MFTSIPSIHINLLNPYQNNSRKNSITITRKYKKKSCKFTIISINFKAHFQIKKKVLVYINPFTHEGFIFKTRLEILFVVVPY